jgi:hypothetical protein
MAVLIFVAIIFAWALLLGRTMGGTGTWLPTGGRTSAPEPDALTVDELAAILAEPIEWPEETRPAIRRISLEELEAEIS